LLFNLISVLGVLLQQGQEFGDPVAESGVLLPQQLQGRFVIFFDDSFVIFFDGPVVFFLGSGCNVKWINQNRFRVTRDRCCDFKNIFAEKIGVLYSKQS
jgi:hypothetical protein